MGIPLMSENIVSDVVIYQRATNMNLDQRVPLSLTFNSSTIFIPYSMDFTQREYTFKYYTILDVISAIGGVNAFIAPVMSKLAPLFVLGFLFKLAVIIKGKYMDAYRNELTQFVKYALDQLNQMSKNSNSTSQQA